MKTIILLLLLSGTVHAQGVERWKVKTLTDRTPLDTSIHYSTVAELVKIKRPTAKWLTLPRQAVESNLTEVTGTITEVGKEADGDYHIVLSDGNQTMIIEIPDGSKTTCKYSHVWQQLRAFIVAHVGKVGAIKKVKPFKVTVRGFCLFDKPAHGTGHSINGIEIHPVLYLAE